MNEKNKIELLRDFELSLVNPYVRKSREELENLLSDDFVEFGSSGKIYDKKTTIESMLAVSFGEISITGFNARFPSDDIALVTYEAQIRDGKTKYIKKSLRSSLWKREKTGWKILFHQGTAI